MAGGTWRRWNASATAAARIFLTATLLLRASVSVFQLTLYSELLFSLELLLGVAIATGWLIRYAAGFVLLATAGVSVLTPHVHLILLPPNSETTVAVLIASGYLVCFGRNANRVDVAPIDENNRSSHEHLCALPHDHWDQDVEVTIRLEDSFIRSLRRHRCIVTIRDRVRGVQTTGQETWYCAR